MTWGDDARPRDEYDWPQHQAPPAPEPRPPRPRNHHDYTLTRTPREFLQPARPIDHATAKRRALLTLFWVGLVLAVGPWWLATPSGSLEDSTSAIVAAARITGLVAGYVLIVQVLLMSQVTWPDRWVGSKRLVMWHRELGGFVVVAVLVHLVLVTLGYAGYDKVDFFRETWRLLSGYEDMIGAYIAASVLFGIGLTSIRSVRRALRYELWYVLHLSAYVALFFGYGHQFAQGQQLLNPGFSRTFWIGLYLLVLGAVLYGRVIRPLTLNLRHRLYVVRVVPESPDVMSVYIGGHSLDRLRAKAGQYFRWRFLTAGTWWQSHPFSLSAAPNERFLRLTIKVVGDHTARLARLRPGARVYIEGPFGEFTADRRTSSRALLIAGGSGIGPIRALLEELPPGAVVVYRARTPDDLALREELDLLAAARAATVWYVVGGRNEPGPRHLFTPRGLRELVPDIQRRDVYLCGPDSMVRTAVNLLKHLSVPRRQIHLDPFEF